MSDDDDDGMTDSEKKIGEVLIARAVEVFNEEHGDDWDEAEVSTFVMGMWQLPVWLPIDTMPSAVGRDNPCPELIWWGDTWTLVTADDGEWITNDDELPFQSDDKPLYWCRLPRVPFDVMLRFVKKILPKVREEHKAAMEKAGTALSDEIIAGWESDDGVKRNKSRKFTVTSN
jgi:hypothetical protein